MYFLEGERTHTTTHEYHGLQAHLLACTRERERQEELAFLSNVDLDEAIFDFEKEKSNGLKGTQSDAKESASRRTRSFQTAVNARDAAKRWHYIHRAMGHPSRAVTDAIVNSGKFGYIPQCSEVDKSCEHCRKAAFFRPRYHKHTSLRSPMRGAKWHVDLAGPFKPDRLGRKYAMNLVDDCTGFTWACALRSKADAVLGMRKFIDWLKHQRTTSLKTVHMISCLQSDRGGEFTSGPESLGKKRSHFDKICKKLNIERRFTSAYSPQQNGRAERANRTLFSSMRCNLMHSGLGWKYWVDAYLAGLYSRNRNPRENNNPSRFEMFYGKAPSLKRMVPFGSVAYIEKKTDKTSISRAIQGKMIGYPADTQGWLFVCSNQKLVATRHAWFDKRSYAERALAKGEEPPRDQGFVETEGTPGIPLGGSDAKIRELVNDIIPNS